MAETNVLDALFKKVYGDGTIKAVPDFAKLMKMVPFRPKEKLGDEYIIPVILQYEHGFSYGEAGDSDFALNPAVAGKVLQAKVKGFMIVLRSKLSYEDVHKAAAAGEAAFESATSLVVENMQRSFSKRQELSFWYGQQSLACLSSVSGSSTTRAWIITDATWAPGIWSGMKDCPLDVYSAVSATATQRNVSDVVTITSVDIANKTLNVSGDASDLTSCAAADFLYFYGARTATAHKECAGIDKILSNTGTLFNIDAGTYELWKATTRTISGQISFLGILNGIGDAVNMGLDEQATLFLPTKRWNQVMSDQAALRRHNAQMTKAENGFEAVTFYSTNGKTDIVNHPFLKEARGYLIPNPEKRLVRVGATDITFKRPGLEHNIFRELSDNAGFELRAFSDQAIALQIPGQATLYESITD
jgi:hypothetical protein